jgi:hypothetical protein
MSAWVRGLLRATASDAACAATTHVPVASLAAP